MKSDIEIALEAELQPIQEVAKKLDIQEEDLDLYGKYKAKLTDDLWDKIKDRKDGRLILVTAINPTPAGEGKTTTTVGLGQAMDKLGKKAVIALREPSLGPCFGIKGGAAGGGYAQVVPMEDINLHFTGDPACAAGKKVVDMAPPSFAMRATRENCGLISTLPSGAGAIPVSLKLYSVVFTPIMLYFIAMLLLVVLIRLNVF